MTVFFVCAGILGLLAAVLALNISRLRRGRRVSLGHGGDKELETAVRAHGNLMEWAPFVMLLIWLLHGPYGDRSVAILAILFTLSRLAHAGGMLGFIPTGRVVGAVVATFVTIAASIMLLMVGLRAL